MQVWNLLHAACWKYRTQKSPKIRHLGTIAQLYRAESLQLRHISTIGKKLVKQQYLFHTFVQYAELPPTNGWDRFGCLGHPSKFQRVLQLGFVTAVTSLTEGEPNFARCWPSSGLLGYIYIFGGSCPLTKYARLKIHVTSKSCFLLPCWHGTLQQRRQPNFAASYKE